MYHSCHTHKLDQYLDTDDYTVHKHVEVLCSKTSSRYGTSFHNIMAVMSVHSRCRCCLVLTQKYNILEQQYCDPGGHW